MNYAWIERNRRHWRRPGEALRMAATDQLAQRPVQRRQVAADAAAVAHLAVNPTSSNSHSPQLPPC